LVGTTRAFRPGDGKASPYDYTNWLRSPMSTTCCTDAIASTQEH